MTIHAENPSLYQTGQIEGDAHAHLMRVLDAAEREAKLRPPAPPPPPAPLAAHTPPEDPGAPVWVARHKRAFTVDDASYIDPLQTARIPANILHDLLPDRAPSRPSLPAVQARSAVPVAPATPAAQAKPAAAADAAPEALDILATAPRQVVVAPLAPATSATARYAVWAVALVTLMLLAATLGLRTAW